MKIHIGFISNSSSTSFILAVKPEKAEDIKFILDNIGQKGGFTAKGSEKITFLKKEIKGLRDNLKYLTVVEEAIKILENSGLAKDIEILHDFRYAHHINNLTPTKEITRLNKIKTLYNEKESVKRFRTEINEKIIDLNKQISLLTPYPNWEICSFSDSNSGYGKLTQMTDKLIDDKNAILLKKETD